MSEFKNLPYFDPRHVDYAPQHNATSEAVIQLQRMVVELQRQVAELKEHGALPKKTSTRGSAKTADS